jgi:hypothetical protein
LIRPFWELAFRIMAPKAIRARKISIRIRKTHGDDRVRWKGTEALSAARILAIEVLR